MICLSFLLLLFGCDHDPTAPRDSQAPAKIMDLSVVATAGSVTLGWTSPGDDGNRGEAQEFELRFSASPLDSTNLLQATVWDSLPDPGPAGTTHTLDIGSTLAAGTWYFAIRTRDEADNWSPWSSVLQVNIAAAPTGYAPATTPDQAIANFVQAHLDLDFREYDRLLGDNFQFWFAAEDLNLAPNGFFWNRAFDSASTERMFNGSPGVESDGSPQPPISRIELSLTPSNVWTDAGANFVSQVNGEQLFYLVPSSEPDGNGGTRNVWQMEVWRDFGSVITKAGVILDTWGRVKARY